jgi:hypothetical protein
MLQSVHNKSYLQRWQTRKPIISDKEQSLMLAMRGDDLVILFHLVDVHGFVSIHL